MDVDFDVIERISINIDLKDKFIWHYDRTGRYFVKSGYRPFMNFKINEASSSVYPRGNVWKNLWKLLVPTKVKYFCWKALNDFSSN